MAEEYGHTAHTQWAAGPDERIVGECAVRGADLHGVCVWCLCVISDVQDIEVEEVVIPEAVPLDPMTALK